MSLGLEEIENKLSKIDKVALDVDQSDSLRE